MQRRLIALFTLFLLSLPAFAQLKLKLEFPSAGTRQVWVAAKPPQGKLPETTTLEGVSAEFAPASFGPADKLYILDEATGNLASKPMSEIQSGFLKLTAGDFKSIGRVTVRVEHSGEPVESASISLTSGKDSRTQLIDSSSQGESDFFAVPPGAIKVSVQYKTTDGETPDPETLTKEVKLQRSDPHVVIVVPIVKDVATIAPAASSGEGSTKAGEGKAAEDAPERGGLGLFGRIVSFLLALGLAALLLYFGLKWMKANQDKVQANLKAMGVEIPSQEAPPPASASPPAPIAPLPPEKIILDDAAPEAYGATPAVATLPGEPRLVSEDGSQIPLDEGTVSVGRDAGQGLSLLNESTVSRQHAELIRSGSSVVLRDLGSTNGTYVNGAKVDGEVTLKPGDRVQFGAVKFRFEG